MFYVYLNNTTDSKGTKQFTGVFGMRVGESGRGGLLDGRAQA